MWVFVIKISAAAACSRALRVQGIYTVPASAISTVRLMVQRMYCIHSAVVAHARCLQGIMQHCGMCEFIRTTSGVAGETQGGSHE